VRLRLGGGQRCAQRTFLEFHHIQPYALGGLATVENISLRCRRHNQYEADLVFGPHGISTVREAQEFQEWGQV
jgi:HNH endonuclease